MVVNMSYICRTCLSESDDFVILTKIINMKGEMLSLERMLSELTSIEFVTDEEMPQTMCEECVYDICKLFFFKRQCIDADLTLKTMLGIEADRTTDKIASPNDSQHVADTPAEISCSPNYNNNESYVDGYSSADADYKYDYNLLPSSADDTYMDDDENEGEEDIKYIIEYSPEQDDDASTSADPDISVLDEVLDSYIQKLGFENDGTEDLLFELHNSDYTVDDNLDTMSCFRCNMCTEQFVTSEALSEHIRVHDADEGYEYKCNICVRIFDSFSVYKSHFKTHDPRISNHCLYCGKQMPSLDKLKQHIISHSDNGGIVNCYFCDMEFSSFGNCRKHMTKCHYDQWTEYNKILFQQAKSLSWNYGKSITAMESNATKHLCDICGKQFAVISQLRNHHLSIHSNERPYKCDFCDLAFTLPTYLKAHIKKHISEKEFKCEVCGKEFLRKKNLQVHANVHIGDRPFKCHICNKGLTTAKSRDMHVRTHFGERPYREQEAKRPPRIRRKRSKGENQHRRQRMQSVKDSQIYKMEDMETFYL